MTTPKRFGELLGVNVSGDKIEAIKNGKGCRLLCELPPTVPPRERPARPGNPAVFVGPKLKVERAEMPHSRPENGGRRL